MLFFDLWTNTGFGDKILDLLAILTVARILGKKIKCKWSPGCQEDRQYDNELFTLTDLTWALKSEEPPIKKQDFFGENNGCWGYFMQQHLEKGIINDQIIPINTFWGTTSLERIYEALPFYGLQNVHPTQVWEAYFDIAKTIIPCKKIHDRINTEGAFGIHIRLSDKCVENPNQFTMNKDEYANIKYKCIQFIKQQDINTKFFVCSEDKAACNELKNTIRELGKNVIEVDYEGLKLDELALLDFFCLSRCELIVQCTKYSTFSIAASLLNRIPLINFYGLNNNALGIWMKTANIHIL